MTTQELTSKELAQFAGLAEEYHSEVMPSSEPFNREYFLRTWSELMEIGVGHVFATEDGGAPREAIGVILVRDLFTGVESAEIVFWFTRGSPILGAWLYSEVEKYCAGKGIKHIECRAVFRFKFDKMHRFLRRSGFHLNEVAYRKTL